MQDWSIELDFENVPPGDDLEDRVDDLLDTLRQYAPTISFDERSLSVTVAVRESTEERAIQRAIPVVMDARSATRLGSTVPVATRAEPIPPP